MRIPCGDCPKEFRTQTGLDWHREHIHQVLPGPQENLSDSTATDPTERGDKPDNDTDQQASAVNNLTVATSRTYEAKKPSTVAQSAPAAPPIEEPRTQGDYNCLDCRGANDLGGFFLKAAIVHHRETGHRLEHIPGSFEEALSQLTSSLLQPPGPPTRT